MDRFSIGNINISRVNLPQVVNYLNESIREKKFGYVCVTNSRVVYQANHDPNYCKIQNESLLTVPDGKPLTWIAHNLEFKEVGQVAGNELFHALLKESKEKGYTHFFYGGSPSTIQKMKERAAKEYADVTIVDAISPPFQPIEDFDIEVLADEVNKKAPTFFWVGLGAPKQEKLMALLQPKLKKTICIGVGLVFKYYAGTVKRAPSWARKLGFEWLYRFLQQPCRFKMLPQMLAILYEVVKSRFKYDKDERGKS